MHFTLRVRVRALVVAVVITAPFACVPLFSPGAGAVTLTRLTKGPSTEADPCFSPDGQRIVCLKDDQFSGNREIWVMPASGGAAILQLTSQNLGPTWPTWSPDGSTIVFVARDKLMSVPAGGGQPLRLTRRGGRHPAWSRDGTSIAFASGYTCDLWKVAAGGGGESLLLGQSFYRELDPTFSPDGERIAFASDRSGHLEIYVCPVAGGEETQLTDMRGTNLEPAWSPDGNWIAFSRVTEPDRGIWVVPAAGGTPVCLTCSGFQDGTPSWSPDSRSLAFDRHMVDNNDDIWIAANLELHPAEVEETTWGRLKAQLR
ncbi:MAG: PD40 domain-containing protein [Candidatus Eisenbacteria bacterium]|nr:PD40 domain-containing protein [Candidatus Eisenbacteria bacterium]